MRPAQRGLSIIELMIGITISLFILAGATMVVSSQLADNRKLLLEVQMQQDMRAVLDLVARDLRRAAYWGKADENVWPAGTAPLVTNPYSSMSTTSTALSYTRSLDETRSGTLQWRTAENNVANSDEQGGFRFNGAQERIETLIAADNWQSVTDENVMKVTQFQVTMTSNPVPAPCGADCPLSASGTPLQLCVRSITLTITAKSAHDPRVVRSVQSTIRLRNDLVAEACA